MTRLACLTTLALACVPLAACGSMGDVREELAHASDAPECDATNAQNLVGQLADAEMGQRLLRATGAQVLRWGPPDSAMTMDFRPDRLTVSYDASMAITRIACG